LHLAAMELRSIAAGDLNRYRPKQCRKGLFSALFFSLFPFQQGFEPYYKQRINHFFRQCCGLASEGRNILLQFRFLVNTLGWVLVTPFADCLRAQQGPLNQKIRLV